MPAAADGLVVEALTRGFAAWRRRLGLLTLAFAAIAAVNLPVDAAQRWASGKVAGVSDRTDQRAGRIPEPQEAIAELTEVSGACAGLCGAGIFAVAVLMPLVSGAAVLGARAARGNPRPSDLLCGFRRYVPTVAATLVTSLAGGGIAVAVATVDTLTLLGSASRAVGTIAPPALVRGLGAVILAVTLWLCARLWFASIRVADPGRPRIGGFAAVSASWQWTHGPVQWKVLAVLLAASAGLVPGIALSAAVDHPAAAFAGAWLGVTWALALTGAAYECVASRLEPTVPPAAPAAATADAGGLDA